MLEAYEACRHNVPIVAVNVQGSFPYVFQDAANLLADLKSKLSAESKKIITDFGVDLNDLQHVLHRSLTRVISRPFTPSASKRTIQAQLEDIIDCMGIQKANAARALMDDAGDNEEDVTDFFTSGRKWKRGMDDRDFIATTAVVVLPGGYVPLPLDVSTERIAPDLVGISEVLAEHSHNLWARSRLDQGYQFGANRCDDASAPGGRRHNLLIPYQLLPDDVMESNRSGTIEILKTIQVLGYVIQRAVANCCTLCWDEAVREEAACSTLQSLVLLTENSARVASPLFGCFPLPLRQTMRMQHAFPS